MYAISVSGSQLAYLGEHRRWNRRKRLVARHIFKGGDELLKSLLADVPQRGLCRHFWKLEDRPKAATFHVD